VTLQCDHEDVFSAIFHNFISARLTQYLLHGTFSAAVAGDAVSGTDRSLCKFSAKSIQQLYRKLGL